MKAVLIISSLLLSFALGDVVTNTYGTYLRTPDAVTKMTRSDSGYSYSVTSTGGHPSSFLYGVQPIATPLAFTYSTLGVNPIKYFAQNILPYEHSAKYILPFSTVAFSPLASQLSAIYQTSSIPALLQDNRRLEGVNKPVSMEQAMMDQQPSIQQPMMPQGSQNPFFTAFAETNNDVPQQNPVLASDPSAVSVQGNTVDDDTVSIESA